jgi:hypothetical protein
MTHGGISGKRKTGKRNVITVLLLMLLSGLLVYLYLCVFPYKEQKRFREMLPDFMIIIIFPMGVWFYNTFGLLLSMICFRKVKQIIIGFILFTGNLLLSFSIQNIAYQYIHNGKQADDISFVMAHIFSLLIFGCVYYII